jgi:hypothetical protein
MIYLNLDYGKVGLLIGADHFSVVLDPGRVVLQPHLNAISFFDHMAVGHDETLGVN